MKYIELDPSHPFDLVLLGRIAVDFNPADYFQPLEECTTFKKYVGGSPANIAVGAARHGMKIGFFARVSGDQFGDYVTHFFEKEGIDTSRVRRCEHGEKIGLTFTEILSRDESSILMYRDGAADLQLILISNQNKTFATVFFSSSLNTLYLALSSSLKPLYLGLPLVVLRRRLGSSSPHTASRAGTPGSGSGAVFAPPLPTRRAARGPRYFVSLPGNTTVFPAQPSSSGTKNPRRSVSSFN